MSESKRETEFDDGYVEVTSEWVWICPWCSVAFQTEGDAYTHTYNHQDKAPYAVDVLDQFEKIPVVEPRHEEPEGDR